MEEYWDQRAREDAFHYVDSREALGSPDLEAFWRGGEEVVDRMLDAVEVRLTGDEEIVEIGCGIGRLTRVLAARGRAVKAFDISEEMLAQARQHNQVLSNVDWIHGDGRTLAPLPDESADACLSFVVFQHLPDPELTYGYVREIGRVLRPSGWAVFHVSTDPRVHEAPSVLQRLRRSRRVGNYDDPAWWGSAVELSRLREAAADGGMELERVENEGTQFCFVLARARAQPA
jgi:SAM-dependent methyltransferase